MISKTSIMSRRGLVLLAFLLIFSLCFTIIPVVPALAEGTAVLTVENVSAVAGETVTVDVSIQNCPICYAITLIISYDTTAMTLTKITRGPATNPDEANFMGNPSHVDNPGIGKLLFDGNIQDDENKTFYMPVSDGVLFSLTFDVKQTAGSGDYNIIVTNDGFFDPYEQSLPMSITNGVISVTGDPTVGHEASYSGKQYLTFHSAFNALIEDGGVGTITMLNDATVSEPFVIPADAEITIDMNGKTITSEKPYMTGWNCLIEIQAGGKLNIVDNSPNKGGKFVRGNYGSGPFLVNSGTLNMSDIYVDNFIEAIVDGSSDLTKGQSGKYGTISNCKFKSTSSSSYYIIDLHSASVGTITGCTIEVNNYALRIGTAGKINLFEDCTIIGNIDSMVSIQGTIETIRDCNIVASDDWRVVIYNDGGTIDTITSTSADKHTTITGRVDNAGTIGSIESDYTSFNSSGNNIWNKSGGTIGTICGGRFSSTYLPIYVDQGSSIDTISGGIFRSGKWAAIQNDGTISSITGGVFIGGTDDSVLSSYVAGASIGSVTGGYYKSSGDNLLIFAKEGTTITIPEGYAFLPVDDVIDGESGFYCLGKAVNIKWVIDGVEQTENKSTGDPVFYSGETPTKTAAEGCTYTFAGWSDGTNLYSPSDILPPATEDVTYTAVFDVVGTVTPTVAEGTASATVTNENLTIEKHGRNIIDVTADQPVTASEVTLGAGLVSSLADAAEVTIKSDVAEVTFDSAALVEIKDNASGDVKLSMAEKQLEDLNAAQQTAAAGANKIISINLVKTADSTKVPFNGDSGEARVSFAYTQENPSKTVSVYYFDENGNKTNMNATYANGIVSFIATHFSDYGVLEDEGLPGDYTVSLATTAENVNAGEPFTVEVNITSNDNNSFYGATIEVTYDNSKVDYVSASCPDGFGIVSTKDGNITTLKIVGASQNGYQMTNHAYKLATLSFKAKSDIATGLTTFGIKENPIVDQQHAVHSQSVNRGDDILVNLWNLIVTFQAGNNVTMDTAVAYVKYNEAGLYTDTTYQTPFTEPQPVADENYTLDDPVWYPGSGSNVDFETISSIAFTDNAVYTVTASPSGFDVILPDSVNVISGITDGKATYLTNIVFTVDKVPGYVNVVTYTVDEGEPVDLTADTEGRYTIPGSAVCGVITVNVEYIVHGEVTFISNDDFKSLPAGYKVLVLTVSDKLTTGAYEYEGNALFYSGKYSRENAQVYLYAVLEEVTDEEAITNIQINGPAACTELKYDGNVNCDGYINSTDAVLTYGLYGGVHADDVFNKVDMRMRLEADVNGDKTVDTADAQKILTDIWGISH